MKTFSNPTPEPVEGATWTPLDLDRASYLSISLPELTMKNNYYAEQVAFWNVRIPKLDAQPKNNVYTIAKQLAWVACICLCTIVYIRA